MTHLNTVMYAIGLHMTITVIINEYDDFLCLVREIV